MSLFTWNESYSVGINQIDRHHQEIMNMINELNEAMLHGKGREIVGGILKKLINYTASHFAYEEKLMSQHGYPEYDEHKAKHDKMVDKVLALQKDVNANKLTVSSEVMKFLQDWLNKHIMGTDKKYAPFLQGKGVQ
jgi:hemerythrin